MAKLTSATLAKAASQAKAKGKACKAVLMTCSGTGCGAAGGLAVAAAFTKALKKHKVQGKFLVSPTGCQGFCSVGPVVVVQPAGIFYQQVKPGDCERIVTEHLMGGKVVVDLLYHDPATGKPVAKLKDIPFFAKQSLVALRNRGLVDPDDIESSLARGGYQALAKALKRKKPETIVDDVIASGLRGRGGAGFPTGKKWKAALDAARAADVAPYLFCNADGPQHRSIVEADPHSVIEGMVIGAYALGAREGFIYFRKEYDRALARLEKALAQARARGLLGKKILGTGFSFDLRIKRSAGAFVSGEDSALLQSAQGLPPEPQAKYVHATEVGFRGQPTVVNNVETWATVPVIIDKGPAKARVATKVLSLGGDLCNVGMVEVPLGTTLKEVVNDLGGGVTPGKKIKAVQVGGPSGGVIPARKLGTKVDFEALKAQGAMVGSGNVTVLADDRCMVDHARYLVDFLRKESCGKCTPCREGTVLASEILREICEGRGTVDHLGQLQDLGRMMATSALCQLGRTAANPILTTLEAFKAEYEAHVKDRKCAAGVCKAMVTYHIEDTCIGCTLCARKCPVSCIAGERKKVHVIDQAKCIKCGVCKDVCPVKAVTKA